MDHVDNTAIPKSATKSTTSSSSSSLLTSTSNQQQQHTLSHAYQTFFQQRNHHRHDTTTTNRSTSTNNNNNDNHPNTTTSNNDNCVDDELTHYNDVCRAYRQYAMFVIKQYGLNYPNRIGNISSLHQQNNVLPQHLQYGTIQYNERLQLCKHAAIRNQFLFDCILQHAGQPISQQQQQEQQEIPVQYATEAQLSKVTSVLKSLARDWSVEGATERNMAYQPILQSIQKYIPPYITTATMNTTTIIKKRKICVPGAGVGRLACEIAALGDNNTISTTSNNKYYTVQGNEFSLYMLLASDFILNGPVISVASSQVAINKEQEPNNNNNSNTSSSSQQQLEEHERHDQPHPISISPWLLETRNVQAMTDPFRTVQIPDVDPFDMVVSTTKTTNSLLENDNSTNIRNGMLHSDFSMTAGDFSTIYSVDSEKNVWDGVVTCFFLDASPNIIEYLQVIYHMLQPGGILINFGPLHWHYSGPPMLLTDNTMSDYYHRYDHLDDKYMQSYDYCWDDIQTILYNIGFDILEQTDNIPAYYTIDVRSMIRTEYRCIHFVAQKRMIVSTTTTATTTT